MFVLFLRNFSIAMIMNSLLFRILTLMALLSVAPIAVAQAPVPAEVTPISGLQQVFKGKYHFIDEATGDTVCMIVFNPITI